MQITCDAQHDPRHVTLQQLALQRRLDALFRALAADFLLREQFITDPAQITSEYVYGKRMPEEEASTLNYLIYSCLANTYLISWFRDYSLHNQGQPITQRQFMHDFTRAVVEFRAHHVVTALVHLASSEAGRIRISDHWLQVIFGRWHRFGEDGTEPSTDSTGTESTGTDSTGTDSTGTESTGTESTGTGGTGTEATGTEATGTESTGTDSTGTDITGTDITGTDATEPTTGQTLTAITWKTYVTDTTDKTQPSTTPFTHTGITRSPITTENTQRFLGTSYVVVTLEALTSYARELVRADALEAVRIE